MLKNIKQFLKQYKIIRKISRKLYRYGWKNRYIRKPIVKGIGIESWSWRDIKEEGFYLSETEYGKEECIEIQKAKYISMSKENEHWFKEFSICIFPSYLYNIPHVTLAGKYALAFTCQNQFIQDSSYPIYIENKEDHSYTSLSISSLLQLYFGFSQRLDFKVASLINAWNGNYFHWVTDMLPRVQAILLHQQIHNCKVKVLIEKDYKPYQKDSLLLLGIKEENIIYWEGKKTLVKEFILPSFRKGWKDTEKVYRFNSMSSLKWVRDTILSQKEFNNIYPPKIYISRSKANGRHILNEAELLNILKDYNYHIYYLEDLSFEEQVVLFSKATHVISPHGAGLTNLCWGDNIKVLEIFSAKVFNNSFSEISRAYGHDYYCMEGEKSAGLDWDSDILINIEQFKTLLSLIENN